MIKKIVSYVLVLLLIIALLASIIITIISNTILNEKFILNLLSKNNYYEKTYKDIIETFKDNTIQSGLTDNVLEGIITQEKVNNDVKLLITYLYNDKKTIDIDVESIKTKLQENIEKQILENNKKVTKDEKADINTYVETISNIYINSIVYSIKYIQPIQKAITKINSIINKVQIATYILTFVLAIIIIVINKKKSFKYLSIASITTGTLLLIVKIIEVSSMQIKNLLLLNKAFSEVLICLIQNIMNNFLMVGIILCIVGIVLSIVSCRNTNK